MPREWLYDCSNANGTTSHCVDFIPSVNAIRAHGLACLCRHVADYDRMESLYYSLCVYKWIECDRPFIGPSITHKLVRIHVTIVRLATHLSTESARGIVLTEKLWYCALAQAPLVHKQTNKTPCTNKQANTIKIKPPEVVKVNKLGNGLAPTTSTTITP